MTKATVIGVALGLAALVFVLWALVRSIKHERTTRSIWADFALSLSLFFLFAASWVGHGFAQWDVYAAEQRQHDEAPQIGEYLSEFAQSTLENWQSEFLQLFAFVVLAALYIHRGSAESKDSDDKIEAALRRIEEQLGTLSPDETPDGPDEQGKLPDAPEHAEV